MKKYFEILRKCPLFSSINDDDLQTMLGCLDTRVETFDKKYTIISEGGPANFIGIVLSGGVQVVQNDFFGNRSVIAGMEPGEIFGEAFACAEVGVSPVAVIASEPTEVMLIDSRHLLHTCARHCSFHQQLIFNLMKALATKNIMFHQKLEITSKRSTREKLMAYLALQAQKNGSSSFSIPFDRQALADYLEVDRTGLSAEIGKLRREGLIENKKNHFTLL